MIIIGGGVGPMAGVELHRKIIARTPVQRVDRDHLPVLHISFPSHIPDRTEYLMSREGPNPGRVMAKLIRTAAFSWKHLSRRFSVGIPCNTFHTEDIYNVYLEALTSGSYEGIRIEPFHMLNITISSIKGKIPSGSKIGILSTTGTRISGVWRLALEREGFSVIETDPETQDEVHNIIYNDRWGLKSVWPPAEKAVHLMLYHLRGLSRRRAMAIILGCTELPLAIPENWEGPTLIDPVDCLADALVKSHISS